VVLRQELTILLMAVMLLLVMSAAPALAGDTPKGPQPASPPGIGRGQADPPEQAPTPNTGIGNKHDYGNCLADSCL
jgi:hypothetical protein